MMFAFSPARCRVLRCLGAGALAALLSSAPAADAQALAAGSAGPPLSRLDLYGGYGYFHPFSSDINEVRYEAIHLGAVASVTAYLTPHFGLQAEGNLFPQGPEDHNCVYSAQAGPVLRGQRGRLVPFAHVLAGGAVVGGPIAQPCGVWGYGFTAGGGLDILLPGAHERLALRPLQLDFSYSHIDNGVSSNPEYGGIGDILALRYSAGLVLRLGEFGVTRRIDTSLACTAEPSTILAGDPVVLLATVSNLHTGRPLRYDWSASGGRITGSEATAQLDSSHLAPGEYNVAGSLLQADRGKLLAACTATFVVEAPAPPAVRCSASPATVHSGDPVRIGSVASSADGRPLTFSYTASNGQIAGDGASVTLRTDGLTPGTVDVLCKVADDRGQSAAAHALVVIAAPTPPAPVARAEALCSLSFERDRRRPTRVDNEAKGCLDDIALRLNRDPASRLILEGTWTRTEAGSAAGERAQNAAAYLVGEKGIDRSRLTLRAAPAASRGVRTLLLPAGVAAPPATGSDETATPQP